MSYTLKESKMDAPKQKLIDTLCELETVTPEDVLYALSAYEAARSPHEAQGCDVATVKQWCPSCGGNDANYPCAYPGEDKRGCMRNERLQSDGMTIPKLLAALKQAREALEFYSSDNWYRTGYEHRETGKKLLQMQCTEGGKIADKSLSAIDAVLGEVVTSEVPPQEGAVYPSTQESSTEHTARAEVTNNNQSDECRKAWQRNSTIPFESALGGIYQEGWQAALSVIVPELLSIKGTLEPIAKCGWHGKWRIEKVLKMLDKLAGK